MNDFKEVITKSEAGSTTEGKKTKSESVVSSLVKNDLPSKELKDIEVLREENGTDLALHNGLKCLCNWGVGKVTTSEDYMEKYDKFQNSPPNVTSL